MTSQVNSRLSFDQNQLPSVPLFFCRSILNLTFCEPSYKKSTTSYHVHFSSKDATQHFLLILLQWRFPGSIPQFDSSPGVKTHEVSSNRVSTVWCFTCWKNLQFKASTQKTKVQSSHCCHSEFPKKIVLNLIKL